MNPPVANIATRPELPAARIMDCTVEQYHRDPCATPSLSASCANELVSKSPLHAWTRHPKFGKAEGDDEELEAHDKETKAKVTGTLVHRLILGKGADLCVIDADSFRSNYAKDAKREAKAAGQIPVLAHKLDALKPTVEHLRERCKALGYEFTGQSEVAVEWFEQGAAGPVICRSMLDHAFVNHGVIWDVKTIRSAHPKQIARNFVEHGYDIQQRAYTRALAGLAPKLRGRVDMIFLFMEVEPPYAVVPVRPDGALLECGKQRWGRAVSLWESCLAKNVWPSYTESVITLEAPEWVIRQELGRDWA